MVSFWSTLDYLILVSSLLAFLAVYDHQRRGGLPYPPGPQPLPLIGNLFDIPKQFSWLTFTEFSKKHGGVMSFHIFGQVIVVLNSIKATKDLLEKRGDVYSDRPAIPICKMMKWQWLVPLVGYTDFWRQTRKLLDRSLRPGAIMTYHRLLQSKVHTLLSQLLANPDKWESHPEYLLGELILGMGYGYQVKGRNDLRVDASRKLSQLASKIILPGSMLVNDFPLLRYIPEWLPWLSYKPLARYGFDLGQEVVHGPMKFVRESILNGTAQPSLALENLRENDKLDGGEREKAEDVIAGALGSMYAAGVDTTVSTIMSFFVAMLLRPDIQTTAQNQLDAVTGRQRLPSFEDRPGLPFIDAICREVLRWRPVTPLALPHKTVKDDVYEGLFIPKGAIVMGNVWTILRDPVRYPEPDEFKPERFLNSDGTLRDDPVLATAFGFGKRICPGRHFVDSMLFILVASLLSVFNIEKGNPSENGSGYSYSGTGISRPKPFDCVFTPRDRTLVDLIITDAPSR